jgi:hypothetical protein
MVRDPIIFCGKRFIGNKNPNPPIVHDLTLENKKPDGCQIDEILVGHIKTFDPDTLKQAKKEKFDPCDKCIGKKKNRIIKVIKDK